MYSSTYNLSFERLQGCAAIQPALKRALWVLLDAGTTGLDMVVDAVHEMGAEYSILPYSMTRTDYLDPIAALVEERL